MKKIKTYSIKLNKSLFKEIICSNLFKKEKTD